MALCSTMMIHFTCVPVLTSDETDLRRTTAESKRTKTLFRGFSSVFLGPRTKTTEGHSVRCTGPAQYHPDVLTPDASNTAARSTARGFKALISALASTFKVV